jgi:hypothetical protein
VNEYAALCVGLVFDGGPKAAMRSASSVAASDHEIVEAPVLAN